jgi:protein-L-isoaspartate(D-aspartate) O-methyltransferase
MNMFSCYKLLLLACLLAAGCNVSAADYADARANMVKVIEKDVRDTSLYLDKERLDERVMTAMGKVPRHKFVRWQDRGEAYENRPLPVGHGQTISQPFIVALMTDLLKPEATYKALEVGTGSGYQAAVLSALVQQVYTIEIIDELGQAAEKRLSKLNYDNVEVRLGDGYYGIKEHAPYDVIIVTAAASHVPPPLIQQLRPGGRMIIPVGTRFMVQQLVLIEKSEDGEVTARQILPVRFVPLTGEH